ncbi:MAG: alpha/beta hydrolase family protein [Roseiarcus sp.]
MGDSRIVGVGSVAGAAKSSDARSQPANGNPAGDNSDAGGRPLFPDDAQFWFETVRVFGAADYGGSQFGEVLAISRRIKSGDYDSWYDAWNAAADRVAEAGDDQLKRGHRVSARDSLLRASNYYRSSEFFLHGQPKDPRIARAYRRAVECYKAACGLFEPPIEPVEVPYGRHTLPGYFHSCAAAGGRRATVIMHSGFDGSAEEMHFMGARAAVERGYNVLAFDGPGQFGPLHRDGLTFRPDWEKVVTPVVDFVAARKDVDARRIALMGVSMGGELAPRAAAFERRLAACIANDGVYDAGAPVLANSPPGQRAVIAQQLRVTDAPEIDSMLEGLMKTNPTLRWALTHGMYAMGAPTPRAYAAACLDYNLMDGIAEAIRCPTLVCDAEADLFFRGQPQALFDHLTCPKTLMRFTEREGAGDHCQAGASRLAFARIYDWLDETLAVAGQ